MSSEKRKNLRKKLVCKIESFISSANHVLFNEEIDGLINLVEHIEQDKKLNLNAKKMLKSFSGDKEFKKDYKELFSKKSLPPTLESYITIKKRKCSVYKDGYNKMVFIDIPAMLEERKKDNCYCRVYESGVIRYHGNESWQCSDWIENPKFPQASMGGIEIEEFVYNSAINALRGETHPNLFKNV